MRRALPLLSRHGDPTHRLIVMDGSILMHRAYHAFPMLTSRDGLPVSAVYGFAKYLLRVQRELRSSFAVVAFDAPAGGLRREFEVREPSNEGRSSSRQAVFPGYKKGRKEMPPDLSPQFDLAWEVCKGARLACLAPPPGAEADDVIASCVRTARAAGVASVVISTDKDLMQLVCDDDPPVSCCNPNNLGELRGEKQVRDHFRIARPGLLADFWALAGDSVDGIPGVPGIGKVFAASLLAEYGDLEGVLGAAQAGGSMAIKNLGPKKLEALRDHADKARQYRKVLELRDDVETPALEDMHWDPPDDWRRLLVERWGFPSLAGGARRTAAEHAEGS